MQQQGCQHFACAKNTNVKYPLCTTTLVCLHVVVTPETETAIQFFCKTVLPSFIKMRKTVVSKYFRKRGQIKKKYAGHLIYNTYIYFFTDNATDDKTLSSTVSILGQYNLF